MVAMVHRGTTMSLYPIDWSQMKLHEEIRNKVELLVYK